MLMEQTTSVVLLYEQPSFPLPLFVQSLAIIFYLRLHPTTTILHSICINPPLQQETAIRNWTKDTSTDSRLSFLGQIDLQIHASKPGNLLGLSSCLTPPYFCLPLFYPPEKTSPFDFINLLIQSNWRERERQGDAWRTINN